MSNKNNFYLELHALQNFAPSNLNRDDTGSPKDCEFGGVRRARISSQCLKRAMREAPIFAEATGVELAERTRWMSELLAKPLIEAGKPSEDSNTVAIAASAAYYSKKESMDKKKLGRTSTLVFLSKSEINSLVSTILDNWDEMLAATKAEKKDKTIANLLNPLVKSTSKRTSAPDIALFGRMLADQPELNLDAACQVAHAISTHRITMEMDYWTAVDDLVSRGEILSDAGEEEMGAGMMGFSGYDSACFYRYMRLDINQLTKNLDNDQSLAHKTVEGFIRSAIEAVPSGKQNSSAAHNPPSLLMAVVRNSGMGWSLANAFEKPIRPTTSSGVVAPSVEKLDEYWGRLCAIYGKNSVQKLAVVGLDSDLPLVSLAESQVAGTDALIKAVLAALPSDGEAA